MTDKSTNEMSAVGGLDGEVKYLLWVFFSSRCNIGAVLAEQ